MPRVSRSNNVRKICRCIRWKTCGHPWYIDYQVGNTRYRPNLDKLTGRHAQSFAKAKVLAKSAILSWLSELSSQYNLAQQKLTPHSRKWR